MSNLDLALKLASDGYFIFPCIGEGERRKRPCPGVGWRGDSTQDERRIKLWWNRWPTAVPAIDCGRSGFLVLDCDRKLGDGLAYMQTLMGCDTDRVPGSITPSGGRHLIFRNTTPPLGNGRGGLPEKQIADVDVRGDGGYIIAPGAVFEDGGEYRPVGLLHDVGPLPARMDKLLRLLAEKEDYEPIAFKVGGVSEISDYRKNKYGQKAMAESERELAGAPDGTRNDAANLIGFRIGQLVGGGCIGAQEAYERLAEAARCWCPNPRDRVFGLRGTIWRAIQAGKMEPRGPTEEAAPEVAFKFAAMEEQSQAALATPYVRVDPRSLPTRDWLYGWLLVRKFVSFTVAPGGSGKSSLVTAESLAMVAGRDLLGIQPKHGGLRVWLWNLEDPREEITRKIEAISLAYGLAPAETDGRLFVNSGRDKELVIVKTIRGEAVVTPMVEAMVAEVKRLKIDVLVIDPFVSCNEVDENDNSGQDMVVKAWAKVAELGDCAVHLVDHTRKASEGVEVNAGSTRGASSKTDAARVVRAINQMSKSDAEKAGILGEERRKYFRAYNDKSNMAPPAERSDWYKLSSVGLGNGSPLVVAGIDITGGDDVGVVVPWEFPKAMVVEEGAVLKVVADMGDKLWRENDQSPDWLGLLVKKVLGIDAPKSEVTQLIRKWTNEGALERYRKKDDKGNLRWFIRVPG